MTTVVIPTELRPVDSKDSDDRAVAELKVADPEDAEGAVAALLLDGGVAAETAGGK